MILENPARERFDDCVGWRQAIELRCDGEAAGGPAGGLEQHLAACPACRRHVEAIVAIRSGLRGLPGARRRRPDDVLADVWARTIDAPLAGRLPRRRRRPGRVALAAAALLTLTAGVAFFMNRGSQASAEYTEAELARIDHDLQNALVRLGRALRGAERFAVEDILVGETAPALRHMPLGKTND